MWEWVSQTGKNPSREKAPHSMSAAQPRPRAPAPAFHPPANVSHPRLVLRAQMGLSRGLEPSPQTLAVREGLQVALQAWSVSSRLQAKQTSLQALLRPPLREHSTALPLPQASGATGQTPSAPAPMKAEPLLPSGKQPGQAHPGQPWLRHSGDMLTSFPLSSLAVK